MLTMYEADGTTPLSSDSASLTILEPNSVRTLVLKNTGLQTITAIHAVLVMPADSAALAGMTLSMNGHEVPVAAEEGAAQPAQVLDTPLPPDGTIPLTRHWQAVNTSVQAVASARLVLDVVS